MREILFRGQRADNGEWVYGSLLQINLKKTFICDGTVWIGTLTPCKFEVISDTVGQYTGLTDKDGKRIFEGDIVRIKGNPDYPDYANVDYPALIAFLDGGFCAIDGTIEEHAFRRYALARFDFDLEVIGNIHDNPELLEE